MQNLTLPETSQASLFKGIWFVHRDEKNIIRVFVSNTGKEKVFLNNDLMSEKQNIKLASDHQFEDEKRNSFTVKLFSDSIIKGELNCSIIKNNEVAKSFKGQLKKGNNLTLNRLVPIIISSAAFVFIMKHYDLPKHAFYVFLFIVLVISFITSDHGEIIITEEII